MKVLLVEDDPRVRALTVEALTDEGFNVIAAATGEEAIAECRQNVADVLFTDVRLPGEITGWDVAEFCRSAHPFMPVIYATGYSHVAPRPVPGSIWFQKPYLIGQVVSALRRFDELRRDSEGLLLPDPRLFRRHAARCREMAAAIPAERANLLQMARAWEGAAVEAERGTFGPLKSNGH